MHSRAVIGLALAALVFTASTAAAQALPDVAVDDVGVSLTAEDPPRRRDYVVPAIEILGMDIAMNVGSQLAGRDWAEISPQTMKDNLTSMPEWDQDGFSIDQIGHPFCGAVLFSAARSTGHGFWMSGVYAFAGSALWETLMENETPSMNDQITTPFGGMIIGEALHRFSRALLYDGYGKPNLVRRTGATLIDPVGAANRAWWGDAWSKTVPPNMYAHFGMGGAKPTSALGGEDDPLQVHVQFVAEHGLTGDASFRPRRPLDHFEVRTSVDASSDDVDGMLYVRGLALGAGFGTTGGRLRGIGGFFAAYDFSNEERTRHSQLGFGPGTTAELRIGDRGYVQASLAGYLVPWGAAGGLNEEERARRDYHHGPGLAGLAELKLGRKGTGELRATSRFYQIQGTLVDDPANETVTKTTVSGRLNLAKHHAIGVEGDYAYRRAIWHEGKDAGMTVSGRTSEVRAFYAVTTDGLFDAFH